MADGNDRRPESTNDEFYNRTRSLRSMIGSGTPTSAEQRRAMEAIDQETAERQAIEQHRRDVEEHFRRVVTDNPDYRRPRPRGARQAGSRGTTHMLNSERRRLYQARGERTPIAHESGNMPSRSPRYQVPGRSSDFLNGTNNPLNQTGDAQESRYRAKRRKLDDGTYDNGGPAFSYGDEGRVSPGPLQMHIVSCGGREHHTTNTRGFCHPDHILIDDESIYSTEKSMCNIFLKHSGSSPFSLSRIVIKLPSNEMAAHLRQGLVFVSMNDDKLVQRCDRWDQHAPLNHQIQYPDIFRPSLGYVHPARPPLAALEGQFHRHETSRSCLRRRFDTNSSFQGLSLMPGFEVTYDYPITSEGSDAEDEESWHPGYRDWADADSNLDMRSYADRYRPAYLSRLYYGDETSASSESEEDEEGGHVELGRSARFASRIETDIDLRLDRPEFFSGRTSDYIGRYAITGYAPPAPPINRHRDGIDTEVNISNRRSSSSPSPTRPTGQVSPPYSRPRSRPPNSAYSSKRLPEVLPPHTAPAASDNLAPHAAFLRKSYRSSSVIINFDPPVAGRYILLKLWGQLPNGHFDIERITPYGFGGPRFFPVAEMR